MRLLIVRHGEARVPASGGEQALTERGHQQASARAQSLLKEDVDVLFHSPKLRARQTAEILHRQGVGGLMQCDERIVPNADISEVEALLEEQDMNTIALVSHLPLVAQLAAWFCDGQLDSPRFSQYSPTGLVVLELDVIGRGCGHLDRFEAAHV